MPLRSITHRNKVLADVAWTERKKKDMIFLRYINHIKTYIFTELNKNNFYMKIIDLDEIYNFIVLSFFI